jgi:hypothetical protein
MLCLEFDDLFLQASAGLVVHTCSVHGALLYLWGRGSERAAARNLAG